MFAGTKSVSSSTKTNSSSNIFLFGTGDSHHGGNSSNGGGSGFGGDSGGGGE
ncbi:hypothetical protein [Pseudoalteromonas luteoviolacea]|uniref:hypothetical protein n=1 Tax=Pseudoalteromonas luteoviolacea TaxID=43657 RepID=UPI0018C866E9|nr:hypothetical protein [Pseudoalteromonas luteoviolacea]